MSAGPKTYLELYSDPSGDPSNVNGSPAAGYTEIFERWRAVNNAPSSSDVHRDILTDFDSPIGGVGYFVQDPNSAGGVLKVTHGYRVHSGTPGRHSSYRGKTLAYVGDVVGGMDVDTIELDITHLQCIRNETRCLATPEVHAQQLATEPGAALLEPLAADAQSQVMI